MISAKVSLVWNRFQLEKHNSNLANGIPFERNGIEMVWKWARSGRERRHTAAAGGRSLAIEDEAHVHFNTYNNKKKKKKQIKQELVDNDKC